MSCVKNVARLVNNNFLYNSIGNIGKVFDAANMYMVL